MQSNGLNGVTSVEFKDTFELKEVFMAFGVFDLNNEHIYTYDYGNCEETARLMARSLGYGYYSRELTIDEYLIRMEEIIKKRELTRRG